ncbi:MAG: choice-of-anchor X domain-containing protein [Thermoplasmatota archaeon]
MLGLAKRTLSSRTITVVVFVSMLLPTGALFDVPEASAANIPIGGLGPDCAPGLLPAGDEGLPAQAALPVDVRIHRPLQNPNSNPQAPVDSDYGFQEFSISSSFGVNRTFFKHGDQLRVSVNVTNFASNPAVGGDCQGVPIVVADLEATSFTPATVVCERVIVQTGVTEITVNFTGTALTVPSDADNTKFQHYAIWVNPASAPFWNNQSAPIKGIVTQLEAQRVPGVAHSGGYGGGSGCNHEDAQASVAVPTTDPIFPVYAVHSFVIDHVPDVRPVAIAWCQGGDNSDGATWTRDGAHAPICKADMTKNGLDSDPYNTTRYNAPDDDSASRNTTNSWTITTQKLRAGPTHFQVQTQLAGTDWTLTNDSCGYTTCSWNKLGAGPVRIHYHLGVTVTSNLTHRRVPIAVANTSFLDENATSGVMYLYGLSGNLTISFTLDALNELTPTTDANRTAVAWEHVYSADPSVHLERTDLSNDPKHPMDYDINGKVTLNVGFWMTNPGDARAANTTSGATAGVIAFRIYLDPPTTANGFNASEIESGGFDIATHDAFPPGANVTEDLSYVGSNNASSANYVSPGAHRIVAVLDPGYRLNACANFPNCKGRGDIFETNEFSSTQCFAVGLPNERANCDVAQFRIRDVAAPQLSNLTANKQPDGAKVNRSEPVNFLVNMTESDPSVSVILRVVAPSGKLANYTMQKVTTTGPCSKGCQYHFNVSPSGLGDLSGPGTTPGTTPEQLWAAHVQACDASGNCDNSSAIGVHVMPWRIERMPQTNVYHGVANLTNSRINDEVQFFVGTSGTDKVGANATGYALYGCNPDGTNLRGCDNFTGNKIIRYWPPNATIPIVNNFGSMQHCTTPQPPPPLPQVPCQAFANQSEFSYQVSLDKPGRWYFNIEIVDYSHDQLGAADVFGIRNINISINVNHTLPTVHYTTPASPFFKNASESFSFLANVSGDFDVAAVYANFVANTTGYACPQCNVSLPVSKSWNSTADPGKKDENWETNISTGRLGNLTVAGGYTVAVSAEDIYGFWNHSTVYFTLHDLNDPVLTSYGVTPDKQELNANVTFWAVATSDVAFHIGLNLTLDDQQFESVRLVNHDPAHPNNYTFTRNFTSAGSYGWRIDVVDSGLRSAPEVKGTLIVSENLPPRFDVRAPSYVDPTSHSRLAGPQPTIVLFVHDTNGVDENTIRMGIAIGSAALSDVPLQAGKDIVPSTNPAGYVITYTMPRALAHGDRVRVNATARDLSPKNLLGGADFVFTIDARPPTSNPPLFAPSYATQDTDPQNVSLQSLFTLSAHDNLDQANSSVAAIHYQIVKVPPASAERIYDGPFSIASVPHVYVGGGLYTIDYWAEDGVGNLEPHKHLTVFLDDKPPELEPLGELPQGRFINATIDDNSAGVRSATVWYRVNHGPYAPVVMTLSSGDASSGIWAGVLPEGKKGDIDCYYLSAIDRVGNTGTFGSNASNPRACFPVGNHPPVIHITSPGANAKVSGALLIQWTATDADSDPLSFKVYDRLAGKLNYVELASLGDGSTQYALDSTKLPDGSYDLEVTATDGNFVSIDTVRVTIANAASAIGAVAIDCNASDCSTLHPGQTITITAAVTKAGATVEAHIFKAGALITSLPMKDDGVAPDKIAGDNVFTTQFTPTEAGAYSIEIFTRYTEDGVVKTGQQSNAVQFGVKLGASDILASFAALWIALVALVLACIGVAGYALVTKWKRAT